MKHIHSRLMLSSLFVLAAVTGFNQLSGQTLPAPRPVKSGSNAPDSYGETPPLTLANLIQLGLDQNPNLRQAGFDVEAARGRARQAGLYPNPTTTTILDELGDRTGPAGVNTLPLVSQEIVTAHKLRLSQSVGEREADQYSLYLLRQRYVLLTTVRIGYFEILALRQRIAVLEDLVRLADESYETTQKLLKAGQVPNLDVLTFEVERNRFRADLGVARREAQAAWRRLAADMGVPDLPTARLVGALDAVAPALDFDHARVVMLAINPDVRAAEIGVVRAQLALRRAQVEPIPNVTLGAGYVRQSQNRSDDWTVVVGVPVPVFNRNQGNIQAAQAELGRAFQEVDRARNDLTARLATAFGQYEGAQERVVRYRDFILPAARDAYKLALEAFKGGEFRYLQVLQSQQAVAGANLEYVRALGDQWRAASEIAGLLLLEENWPGTPPEGCPVPQVVDSQ